MVLTRQQARLQQAQDQPDKQRATIGSRVKKHRRTTRRNADILNLSSQIQRLLDNDAPQDDFKSFLKGSTDHLDFYPPFDFDNIFGQDVFYQAIRKKRLDVLPWMLERQRLANWNTLHLAVLYDDLGIIESLEDQITELGCVADENGRTPLHLAFHKCNAQVAGFLLAKNCWKNYGGGDRERLGHLAVEANAFDSKKSSMTEWARLIQWLYKEGGMVPETKDSKGATAIDLAREWGVYDVRVKYPLMGWK